MSHSGRKKTFVDPKVQGALVRRLVFHWCAFIGVASLVAFCLQIMSNPFRSFEEHAQQVWWTHGPFLLVMFFLLPVFMGFIWLKQNTPIHLFDTHLGMILVYTAFFTPVAIYFMRYFFAAIPRDLEEAAMVDGCTRFSAFVKIVLPAAAPGLVATFVYAFLFAWDELLFVASLTQNNAETIPIGIRNFIGNYQERTAQLMAAGVVSTLPVLIAFFATQRWLVKGITAGAVKG